MEIYIIAGLLLILLSTNLQETDMKTLNQEMIDRLKKLAAHTTIYDCNENARIDDYAGGNVDDAYELGAEDAKAELAREILVELGLLGAE